MQHSPQYGDVVEDVRDFLAQRIEACITAGISQDRLLVDPGFGFGKTLTHNLQLLKNLSSLRELQTPILVGISRKTLIGSLLGDVPVEERLYGSVAAAVIAAMAGASIIRAHDVRPTVDAMRLVTAVSPHSE